MGKEIDRVGFEPSDFACFQARLREELDLLRVWLSQGRFDHDTFQAGFELEACLLDRHYFPVPDNDRFLESLAHPLVVPELSQFNIELNGTPAPLRGQGMRSLEKELTRTWQRCMTAAHELNSNLIMIGILPTLRREHLTLKHISKRNRYYALNEQILKQRKGRPLHVDISGHDRIVLTQADVMLEAATTSFQVHLQVPCEHIARYYNASILLSGPMVALAANSPFLFEQALWEETRIPIFEQAVDTGEAARRRRRRATFGSGYLEGDPHAYFNENLQNYAPLLPMSLEHGAQRLRHLRLHNGTIWRWNRLLIGFDDGGRPSLRIEHRVMPAGPTIVDMFASAAVYFGAARLLAGLQVPPETELSFEAARENFYRGARYGLDARFAWLGGREVDARELLLDELLPMAREGLVLCDVDRDDMHRYLDVARARVHTGQTGAAWQRAYMDAYGHDFPGMTAAYSARQRSAMPVHEWPI